MPIVNLPTATCVVTGAAGGLGAFICRSLLDCGSRVAAGDASRSSLRGLKKDLEADASRLFLAPLDVTDEDTVEDFLDRAEEALGPSDVLINCAGILRDGFLVSREGNEVRTMSLAQWKAVLDVNLTGTFLATRGWARRIAERASSGTDAGGVVVNVSSVMSRGNSGQANYAASKAGVDAATRSWARELAPLGIRVGGLAPGVVSTPFLDHIAEDAVGELVDATPLQRAASLEEIWLGIRFLIECDFYTGRVLEIDGGLTVG